MAKLLIFLKSAFRLDRLKVENIVIIVIEAKVVYRLICSPRDEVEMI